jgi:hypothetical protein
MQEAVAVSHPSLAATNGLLAEGQVRACDSGSVACRLHEPEVRNRMNVWFISFLARAVRPWVLVKAMRQRLFAGRDG